MRLARGLLLPLLPRVQPGPLTAPKAPLPRCVPVSRSRSLSRTWMPMDFMCASFFISRMRPEAASSALEGTQPRFTQVPPMSWPSITATFMPCEWCVGQQGSESSSGSSSRGARARVRHTPRQYYTCTSNVLYRLMVERPQLLLLRLCGLGCMPPCRWSVAACGTRHRLPHLLDGMQRGAVSTHTAANDDQVIVILGWCCLGNN